MSQRDNEFWNKAHRVLDKLVKQYIDHPDVSLIDIGYAQAEQGESKEEVVLRIHVREQWMKARPEERVAFPDQVEGIPVIVIPGDYRLEAGTPAADEG
jgi:hypothetical protein